MKRNEEQYDKYPKSVRYNGRVYKQVDTDINEEELMRLWKESKLYLFNEG